MVASGSGKSATGPIVHDLAVVEPGAQLAAGVRIGPFCHVGADVKLGEGVELASHVSIAGATTIGAGTRISPHAVLGGAPQDLRHKGGRTTLEIGRNCVIREFATAHAGSTSGLGATKIGDECFLMAYSHVGHDCTVGDKVILTNCATLGGHCEVGEGAILSGHTAVHQFVRIGHHAFIAGNTAVGGDVIPFGFALGTPAKLVGLNIIGLRRAGVEHSSVRELRRAYKALFDPARPFADNLKAAAQEFAGNERVLDVVGFLSDRGKRDFVLPPVGGRGAEAALLAEG
ncbi:acyl-ACP--UDP-N-acetylglucosamine O-acyltransferase [Mesorhizobium sp. Z1-4]|uniref:acyl-ACP--UDP-N-acetylglucosamine O-acyltransferase n=1 Tax=Mesorhizobium sp. Z1-4 TaxID=2448478 RepID=UPI000FD778FF|nr:acyl-ACP--UDP-N-acetylglucosamine O-acyltransferase [Mesorhizobium sp. Z1-4]